MHLKACGRAIQRMTDADEYVNAEALLYMVKPPYGIKRVRFQ